MLTLIVVALLIAFAVMYAGPRYSPAFASRFRRPHFSGRQSNLLLIILAAVVLLWLFGVITVDGLNSPLNTRGFRFP